MSSYAWRARTKTLQSFHHALQHIELITQEVGSVTCSPFIYDVMRTFTSRAAMRGKPRAAVRQEFKPLRLGKHCHVVDWKQKHFGGHHSRSVLERKCNYLEANCASKAACQMAHFRARGLLWCAVISTWLVSHQIMHCHFALPRGDDFFLLLLLFKQQLHTDNKAC